MAKNSEITRVQMVGVAETWMRLPCAGCDSDVIYERGSYMLADGYMNALCLDCARAATRRRNGGVRARVGRVWRAVRGASASQAAPLWMRDEFSA